MSARRCELVLPDLGLPGVVIQASGWLVELGAEVAAGDRLLEVLAGSVTVDLPAPASGVLSQCLVNEDDELHVGQVLAIIVSEHD
jgi:pyruvate/2-oxoglutarate dehydrogenase complex dihydrolipoamide acyltransferase (E2) component